MRIGIDARLLGYRQGGTSAYLRRLLQAFSQLDTEDQFAVFCSRKDTAPPAGPHLQLEHLWTPPQHLLEQWSLPVELLPHQLDVWHSPDFIPPFNRRTPAVITVHDLSFRLFPETKTVESLRYYDQIDQAVRRAQGIIAVSETTRADMERLLGVPPERVQVVYHGCDVPYHPMQDREAVQAFCRSRGLPETFMLWVGTLEPRKNLECLFRALAAVGDRLPADLSTLVLAGGSGWRYEATEQLFQQLGLAGRTRFFGPATEEELLMLYNAAWVFVFPSLYEGFGLPPLEAMACGAPVLASSAPALPEVLGEAALFFDPADPEALAALLLRLAEDPALQQRLRTAGLGRAARFRWQDTAAQTLEVYHQAAAR